LCTKKVSKNIRHGWSNFLNNKFSSKFIVLDGPDGCGKTTQAKLLAEWLQKQGVSTVSFRDPGGTAIGEKIRNLQPG